MAVINEASGTPDLSRLYVRYFLGHRGKYGHEFIEFSFDSDGVLKYVNNSGYKKDGSLSNCIVCDDKIVDTVRGLLINSGILNCDDEKWPFPNQGGRQELEIAFDKAHYSFVTSKINSNEEAKSSADAQGVQTFYKFVHDLRSLLNSLVQVHQQTSPV